jgi:putative transposase
MPRPLSNDLRERLVRAVEGGMSRNAAARHFQVSISAVVRLMQRWAETVDFRPKPPCVYHGHKLSAHQKIVEKILQDRCDLTLKEIQARLRQENIIVSHMGVSRFLDHLGIRYKKKFTPANKTGQTSRQRAKNSGKTKAILIPQSLCLSMKQARQPKWRGVTGAVARGNACCAKSRLVTGKQQPLQRPCGMMPSPPRSFLTAP